MADDDRDMMSLGDHLEDLRRRVMYALLGLVPVAIVALVFGQQLLEIIVRPVERALLRAGQAPTLQALSPLETLASYFKVAFVASVVVGVPWIVYQLWLFVRPGLYEHEQRFARFLVPLSTILAAGAAAFLYFLFLPIVLFFLIEFGAGIGGRQAQVAPLPEGVGLGSIPVLAADPPSPEVGSVWVNGPMRQLRVQVREGADPLVAPMVGAGLVAQQYRLREYVGLVFTLLLSFSIAFQTPIVVMLLSWAGIVDTRTLRKYRRHAFFGCVIAAAVLTPTGDPLTLALMTAPLYLLFELGLALSRFVPASRVSAGVTKPSSWRGAWTDGGEGDE